MLLGARLSITFDYVLMLRYCTCTQAQTKRSPKPGDELDQSIQNMTDKTQDLRKQVRFSNSTLLSFHYLCRIPAGSCCCLDYQNGQCVRTGQRNCKN